MVLPFPSLPSLTPPSFTGGVNSGSGTSVADKAATAALGVVTGGTSLLFGVSAGRLIAIIVGLIIIAAAIFSFRPVRETVVGVAKTAAVA